MIFSKSFCPFCVKVKELFKSLDIEYTAVELDQIEEGEEMQKILEERFVIFGEILGTVSFDFQMNPNFKVDVLKEV